MFNASLVSSCMSLHEFMQICTEPGQACMDLILIDGRIAWCLSLLLTLCVGHTHQGLVGRWSLCLVDGG